jgi:hypothetical protein
MAWRRVPWGILGKVNLFIKEIIDGLLMLDVYRADKIIGGNWPSE